MDDGGVRERGQWVLSPTTPPVRTYKERGMSVGNGYFGHYQH